MKVHHINYSDQYDGGYPESSVALGNFDGLHTGHQNVMKKAIQMAEQNHCLAGVLTLYPHPKEVLANIQNPSYLTPLPDKLDLIETKMGMDVTFVVKFTPELSELSAEQFIKKFIVGLNIKHVVTGFDFRFGHKGSGSTETLLEWSLVHGDFDVHIVSAIKKNDKKISSSRIRNLLYHGAVEETYRLLDRYYACTGVVVHGEKRGRTIGYPTANLELKHPYVLPREGVYAVEVLRDEVVYQGVLNIGSRPTFADEHPQHTFEVHLLNFNEDVYGEELNVQFVSFIRPELKFDSIEQLVKQIEHDIVLAKKRFSTRQTE